MRPFFRRKEHKMKKRKDGRYQTTVYIGLVNGKKKFLAVYGKTQRECRQNAEELKTKVNKGLNVTSDNNTWNDWVNSWLNSYSSILKPRQLNDYKIYLKHFEAFNKIPIKKLQVADFQNIINNLATNNPKTNKPTAKRSLIKYRSIASRIFEYAIENRVIEYNPVKYVKIPQNAPQKARRALTEEEQLWIEQFPHRAQLPAMIMLYSGLRLGECLALQWKDIDFNNKKIDIYKTLVMDKNPPVIKPGAKTEGSVRIVDIPSKLIDFLLPLRKGPFDYICLNTKGNLYNKTSWRKLWDSYISNLNYNYGDFSRFVKKPKSKYQPDKIPMVIDRFTAHYLRHTHATNLIDAGCDIMYVKEQLGHTDIKTTLGIYTHLSQRNIDINSIKLDEMLKESKIEKKEQA